MLLLGEFLDALVVPAGVVVGRGREVGVEVGGSLAVGEALLEFLDELLFGGERGGFGEVVSEGERGEFGAFGVGVLGVGGGVLGVGAGGEHGGDFVETVAGLLGDLAGEFGEFVALVGEGVV